MRLVERIHLWFREGTSDKVYEVDLCDLGGGKFVVNFRYGRRGAQLREGTKTPEPVNEASARRQRDALVAEKRAKGYQPGEPPTGAAPGVPSAVVSSVSTRMRAAAVTRATKEAARARVLVDKLRRGSRDTTPLGRTVWTVGMLRLREAEPVLLELVDVPAHRKDPLLFHALVWAIARCGSEASAPTIEKLRALPGHPPHMMRLLHEAARRVASLEERRRLAELALVTLPEPLRAPARSGSAATVVDAFHALPEDEWNDALRALYRVESPGAHAAVLVLLREPAVVRATRAAQRSIFKIAELRHDAEAFAVCAHAFEKRGDRRLHPYLRRRAARTLRRLGQLGLADYVPMAAALVAEYRDADAEAPRAPRWDGFAGFWSFQYVVHGGGERYVPDRHGKAWRIARPQAGQAPPRRKREEAFPRLWDEQPGVAVELLRKSRCAEVHELGAGVLADARGHWSSVSDAIVGELLASPYDVTQRLAWHMVQTRPCTLALALALLAARATEARAYAHAWITEHRAVALADEAFLAAYLLAPHADSRESARALVGLAPLEALAAQRLVARVIARLLDLDASGEARAADAVTTLLGPLREATSLVGDAVVADLLAHPVGAVAALGAHILALRPDSVTGAQLVGLIGSPHASVRALAARLLAQLPAAAFAGQAAFLAELCTHAAGDLRLALRPTVGRLVAGDAALGRELTAQLARLIMTPLPEGAPAFVVELLASELAPFLPPSDKASVFRLLGALSPHARELGALLAARLDPETLSLVEIVGLGDHELERVREACFALCRRSVERFRLGMPALARLVAARWPDTRAFGRAFVAESFGERDLGPDVLVAFCDSVDAEVQAYGRDLITRHFRAEDGPLYVARLSEHPSETLQTFVSTLLEQHVAGHPERLVALEPYFRTVLSLVNKAGVAKRRCLALLARTALADEPTAAWATQLLERQVVTVARRDREAMVQLLVRLRAAFPEVPTPLRVVPPEARRAV